MVPKSYLAELLEIRDTMIACAKAECSAAEVPEDNWPQGVNILFLAEVEVALQLARLNEKT
jgi:hypothetical protein